MKEFWFKGRIKYIDKIKSFTKGKIEGKLFTLVLFDKEAEIFVTFFHDMVDYYNFLQKDDIIVIENG